MNTSLLEKYDTPTPRYTSYPTVPFWEEKSWNTQNWIEKFKENFKLTNSSEGISIYIHLPFCESLCTYCGCNKRITTNHKVEDPYIEAVIKEWKMYLAQMNEKPQIAEIHLGGGTPTFFSPENLQKLIQTILDSATIKENHEFSIEVHPNFTKKEHLEVLYKLGFRRISLGVQDFDPVVQFITNREQSFETTKEVMDWARELGYDSINIDLIYGLPKQTLESVENTIKLVKLLKPDRIAFYSYAHVPWKSKAQRRYQDSDIPKADEKRNLFELGMNLLKENDYLEIGMDHFALKEDSLYQSYLNRKIHRNFMGYTSSKTTVMIGLGASSISDSWTAFAQNEKEIEAYQNLIADNQFPTIKGHILSQEDLRIREHILNLMCHFETEFNESEHEYKNLVISRMQSLIEDNLLEIQGNKVVILEAGKIFLRNISLCFDQRYFTQDNDKIQFSKSI